MKLPTHGSRKSATHGFARRAFSPLPRRGGPRWAARSSRRHRSSSCGRPDGPIGRRTETRATASSGKRIASQNRDHSEAPSRRGERASESSRPRRWAGWLGAGFSATAGLLPPRRLERARRALDGSRLRLRWISRSGRTSAISDSSRIGEPGSRGATTTGCQPHLGRYVTYLRVRCTPTHPRAESSR